jgi:hypothetical protein
MRERTTLHIKTLSGMEMKVSDFNHTFDPFTKIHYLGAASYPESIVVKIIKEIEVD